MKKEKGLFRNIFINILYEILLVLSPLITAPYLARVLGSEGIGVYSYTFSLVSYFIMIAALGTYSYATIEISKNRKDMKTVSKIFFEIEILTFISTIVCLLFWWIFSIFYEDYNFYLFIFSFSIIAVFFDIAWLYAGLEKFHLSLSVNFIFKLLNIILCLTLINSKDDIWLYILIQSLCLLLGNLSMWIFLPKIIVKSKISFINLKSHFKNTIIYFIPTIAATLYTYIDKTLIGIIIEDKKESGFYEEASKLISIVKGAFILGIVHVLSPRMGGLYSENRLLEIKQSIKYTINILLFFCVGACFGLIAVSDLLVTLFFGAGFEPTARILCFLSPLIILLACTKTIGSLYFLPTGNVNKSTFCLIIGTVINIIFNLFLIPTLSTVGAAISTVIAELIILILYLKKCENIIKGIDIARVLIPKMFVGLIMMSILLVLNCSLPRNWIGLFIEVIIGAVIYIILLLLIKDSVFFDILNIYKITKKEKLL